MSPPWMGWQESNLRPFGSEPNAPPIELHPNKLNFVLQPMPVPTFCYDEYCQLPQSYIINTPVYSILTIYTFCNHLDRAEGFEPSKAASKTAVLPLHYAQRKHRVLNLLTTYIPAVLRARLLSTLFRPLTGGAANSLSAWYQCRDSNPVDPKDKSFTGSVGSLTVNTGR
jgi:hypothetical protein